MLVPVHWDRTAVGREGPGGWAQGSLGVGSWPCHFLVLTLSLSLNFSKFQFPCLLFLLHLLLRNSQDGCEDEREGVTVLGKL